MKTSCIVMFLYCCLVFEIHGQDTKKSKLSLMQGIWGNTMNTDSMKAFTIIKGKHSLNFVFSTNPNELDFPLGESLEGFQDLDLGRDDSLNIASLKEDGQYYTTVDKKNINKSGWIHRPDYLTPNYFECNGENMSINGWKLVEYFKVSHLPSIALSKLYNRGKRDKRNYIKEYLNVEVSEIKSDSPIASEPKGVTKVVLPKGELVYLKETKGAWQKIEYERNEDLLQGWIERKYLK